MKSNTIRRLKIFFLTICLLTPTLNISTIRAANSENIKADHPSLSKFKKNLEKTLWQILREAPKASSGMFESFSATIILRKNSTPTITIYASNLAKQKLIKELSQAFMNPSYSEFINSERLSSIIIKLKVSENFCITEITNPQRLRAKFATYVEE